jgi:hypothetical protein
MNQSIKYKAIYFKTACNQEGNLFKNKKKELLLLIELAPSKSVFSAIFKITFVFPAVAQFIPIRAPTTIGAPTIIKKVISLTLVLGDPPRVCQTLGLLYVCFIYKFNTVLYKIIELMNDPTTLTSTFSLIICTNGVSINSNPLVKNSFIVISPKLPKGLFGAKVFVKFNSETNVSLLACINSLYSRIFELVNSLSLFIMSLIKDSFLTLSQISSCFNLDPSVSFCQF